MFTLRGGKESPKRVKKHYGGYFKSNKNPTGSGWHLEQGSGMIRLWTDARDLTNIAPLTHTLAKMQIPQMMSSLCDAFTMVHAS